METTFQSLADSCLPLSKAITVDKISAAQIQIKSAMICFYSDDWVSTITLAGAAENMLPQLVEGLDLFNYAKTKIAPAIGLNQTQFISQFNEHRDWLKHPQPHMPDRLDFLQFDAALILLRACTRYFALTQTKFEELEIFENWVTKNSVLKTIAPNALHNESLMQ